MHQSLQAELRLQQDAGPGLISSDPRRVRVVIRALNDRVNSNGWRYENLEQHLSRFSEIPILTAYLAGGRVVGGGHNHVMKRDSETGEQYHSYTSAEAERIVGCVCADPPPRIITENGSDWVEVSGFIWRWYSRELVRKLKSRGSMDVSIETLVTSHRREEGAEVEESWDVLGITILGSGISPAVKGAKIRTNQKGASPLITEKRLKEIAARFPGFTCIGAEPDMSAAALLSEEGEPFLCLMEETEGEDPAAPVPAAAQLTLSAEDMPAVSAELDLVLDLFRSRIETYRLREAELQTRCDELQAKLEDMKAGETERRRAAAQKALSDELERFNACREPERRFPETLLSPIAEKIAADEYTALENARGQWTGESLIRSAVAEACMQAQYGMDQTDMQRRRRIYSWATPNTLPSAVPGTIADKLRN